MSEAPPDRPRRRPRYRGTNPRAFQDKSKELNPERYADEVAKVVAAGKTPAGMHRPIMVAEILEILAAKPGDFAVDATHGLRRAHGGAARGRAGPAGRVLALDVDPDRAPEDRSAIPRDGDPAGRADDPPEQFRRAGRRAGDRTTCPGADVVLADLGVSSMQIDDPSRGFTFKRPGPLDLRMNPQRGQPAARLLASLDAPKLARLLEANADQPDAEALAQAIIERQQRAPITTTTDLAETVATFCGTGPERPKHDRRRRLHSQGLPGAADRRQRRARRARHLSAAPPRLRDTRRTRRHRHVPLRRRSPGQAGVQGRRARRSVCPRRRGGRASRRR